jgi:dienelactone hydrolase
MHAVEVRFPPDAADRCAGSLFLPSAAGGPVPCVVMCSGLSCVRDQGMSAVAERFAAAGFAALAIDYRYFGDSDGEPRGLVDGARQRQDLRAGLEFVRAGGHFDPFLGANLERMAAHQIEFLERVLSRPPVGASS